MFCFHFTCEEFHLCLDFPALDPDASAFFQQLQLADTAAEVKGETAALEPTAVSQAEATPPSDEQDEEDEEDAPAEVSFSVSPRLVQVKRLLCSCLQTLSQTLVTNPEPLPQETTPPTGRNEQQRQIWGATMVTRDDWSTHQV